MDKKLLKIQYWCYINIDNVIPDKIDSYMQEIKNNLSLGEKDKPTGVAIESFWIPVKNDKTQITIVYCYDGDVLSCPTRFN